MLARIEVLSRRSASTGCPPIRLFLPGREGHYFAVRTRTTAASLIGEREFRVLQFCNQVDQINLDLRVR